jgi:hypothetical protein
MGWKLTPDQGGLTSWPPQFQEPRLPLPKFLVSSDSEARIHTQVKMVSTAESLCWTRTFFEFIYLAVPSFLKLALSNPCIYTNVKCRALLAQESALGVCSCPR